MDRKETPDRPGSAPAPEGANIQEGRIGTRRRRNRRLAMVITVPPASTMRAGIPPQKASTFPPRAPAETQSAVTLPGMAPGGLSSTADVLQAYHAIACLVELLGAAFDPADRIPSGSRGPPWIWSRGDVRTHAGGYAENPPALNFTIFLTPGASPGFRANRRERTEADS
jgi:hypothetical protein